MRRYITEYRLSIKDFKEIVDFLKEKKFEVNSEIARAGVVMFINLDSSREEGGFVITMPHNIPPIGRKSDEGSLYINRHTRLEQVVYDYCETHRD